MGKSTCKNTDVWLLCTSLLHIPWQEAEAKRLAKIQYELERSRRRKQAGDAAKLQVKAFSSLKRSSIEKHGNVKLPDAVLQQVISCLAGFEPDGVRGPSMAAADLANSALVSERAFKS
jgi:hypothetical protein